LRSNCSTASPTNMCEESFLLSLKMEEEEEERTE
jgi:hypothetical protein